MTRDYLLQEHTWYLWGGFCRSHDCTVASRFTVRFSIVGLTSQTEIWNGDAFNSDVSPPIRVPASHSDALGGPGGGGGRGGGWLSAHVRMSVACYRLTRRQAWHWFIYSRRHTVRQMYSFHLSRDYARLLNQMETSNSLIFKLHRSHLKTLSWKSHLFINTLVPRVQKSAI